MKPITTIFISGAIALALPTAAMAASPAAAGSINAVTGNVIVETGGTFMPVTAGSTINVGDRIIAVDGGAADIRFAGCDFTVANGTSVVITESKSCDSVFNVANLNAGSTADNAALASLNLDGDTAVLYPLLGAAAIVTGVLVVDGDNNDESTSN